MSLLTDGRLNDGMMPTVFARSPTLTRHIGGAQNRGNVLVVATKAPRHPKWWRFGQKAIDYSIKRWDALRAYAHSSNLPIDNKPIENTIRPIAIGKKLAVCRIGKRR